ncbi:MAG: flagellar biosynthetic protein FliR [Verrucomicrobia bacterium]|nr:flagellar biosynthetic protein FliR [Verrucomicrobiota bacterium]
MIPDGLLNWLMVFIRVSAMLAVFPLLSSQNFPRQLRIALSALVAYLTAPMVPQGVPAGQEFWTLVGLMAAEAGIGLMFGFVSRMIFFTVEMAGRIISTEMGLTLSSDINPFTGSNLEAPAMMLYYLAGVIFFSLDLHHWLLVGIQRSYTYLPIGGWHLSAALLEDIIGRTTQIFVVSVQIAAPIIALSFLLSLIFSILSRAVPQMNVFMESFAVRILAGLAVFGLTLSVMSQHVANYLRRMPEDILHVAKLVGGH